MLAQKVAGDSHMIVLILLLVQPDMKTVLVVSDFKQFFKHFLNVFCDGI